MYINMDSPKGCKFFWKVLSFYTHFIAPNSSILNIPDKLYDVK